VAVGDDPGRGAGVSVLDGPEGLHHTKHYEFLTQRDRIISLIRSRSGAFVVFALLAIIHTWPLAANPAHLSRNDNGDALLNEWAVAWVAHQLPRHPLHLFDANIFYPSPLTLGYSEAMIVQGVLAIPIRAIGASPVLTYNILLILGFALTGWAFCLLIHAWTGSWPAAYTGGSLAGFNSHVLVRLTHLQTQHAEFVPLMLFALDRVIVNRRARDAAMLGLGYALQGLTSVYLLVFSSWLLLSSTLARANDWIGRYAWRVVALLALAVAIAVAIMSPYLWEYYRVHQVTGFSRSPDETAWFAGSLWSYLQTGSRLHWALWAESVWGLSPSAAFPGVLCLVLAGVAIASRGTRSDARLRMCAGGALGCFIISFVPRMPGYALVYRLIPLFSAVREPAHLDQFVVMMLAVVAAYGVVALERRWGTSARWPVVAVLLCVAVNAEALRAPLTYTPFTRIPPVYRVLAGERSAVVVEIPFHNPDAWFLDGDYMLNSTAHWRPILNGYSGFRPASYYDAYDAARDFPSVRSLAALHQMGVTHVVVHGEATGPGVIKALAGVPSLDDIASDGPIHIYRLR